MSEHLPIAQNVLSDQLKLDLGPFVKGKTLLKNVQIPDLNPNDHMYASINIGGGELDLSELPDAGCQNSESEVKFWKDWLILHLDLIQQQNDEILNKERTILVLQQENEMLKERISCLERGATLQPAKNNLPSEDTMTQGSVVNENKCVELLEPIKCESEPVSDNESRSITSQYVNYQCAEIKDESDSINTSGEYNYTITSSETDPMKNLKMSIRKKRLSNSSALSNNESLSDYKRPFRRIKKRRKKVVKDTQILTTTEQYVTDVGHTELSLVPLPPSVEEIKDRTLEVPRWRTKVYASCYSMEGTENLDDEVYNKRHIRLENDERRRKRWDVQRIREQRVIEKLKQRQERISSGGRTDDQSEPVLSLWPKVENIKFLEITEDLPVSAFGCPIPKITPSDFTLPWLNSPQNASMVKKVPGRKSSGRKNSTKR